MSFRLRPYRRFSVLLSSDLPRWSVPQAADGLLPGFSVMVKKLTQVAA